MNQRDGRMATLYVSAFVAGLAMPWPVNIIWCGLIVAASFVSFRKYLQRR